MVMTHRLPIKPVSQNEAVTWSRKLNRFVKSNVAHKYRKDLLLILPKLIVPDGDLMLIATFGLSSANADTDNCIKQFQDALQTKYGFDDKRITSYAVDSEKTKKGSEFIEFALIKKIKLKDILVLALDSN